MIGKRIKFEYKDNFSLISIALAMMSILFMGVFGIIEGFCSAYSIAYDRQTLIMVIIAACAVCSCFSAVFFISPLLKTAVYGFAFAQIVFIAVNITDVIKQAALAMANQGYEVVREKYKLPSVDGFEELMPKEFTINAVLILGAVFLTVLFAVLLFELKNSLIPTIIVLIVYIADIYFDSVPSALSTAFMLGFIVLGAVAAHNGAKTGVFINLFLGIILCFCLVFGKNIYNASSLKLPAQANVMKQAADVYIRDLMIKKFSQYKKYKVTSTISGGMLSSYSSVSMSDKTALVVEMERYTESPVFVKAFTGTDYKNNQWTESDSIDLTKDSISITADAMKDYYEPEKMKLASQSMEFVYLPYYSDLSGNENIDVISDDKVIMTQKQPEIEFYPYDEAYVDDDLYYEQIKKKYLETPDINKETIDNICSELELTDDIDDIRSKLSDYFEDFTFTRNPGLIPWQTDFVNYFINESKKGHVAHFATTAVLVYRNMGIPARYAEGYVFNIDESGKTSIPQKNAYAWAEVYVKNFGWVPVDVTPEKFIDENYDGIIPENEENTEEITEEITEEVQTESISESASELVSEDVPDYKLSYAVIWVIAAIVLIAAVIWAVIIKLSFFGNNYNKNIRNIIMHFRKKKYCRKCVSYTECAYEVSQKKNIDADDAVKAFKIFEEIAFGGKNADKQDYIFVRNTLFKINKK